MTPPKNLVPCASVAQCFRELQNYVVLRNEDLFANLQRGGDVDVLVQNLALAERTLIAHFGPPVRITRRSYVTEYYYDWGNVDLLPSLEWRGARYLRTDAVLGGRHSTEKGWFVPRTAHEASISWLTSLLWGGFYKERYAPEIRKAVEMDSGGLRQTLFDVAGKKWGLRLWQAAVEGHPERSATWVRALRRAIWWRACARSPVRTVKRYLAFLAAELRLRLAPPVPWIAILASDGSRKSAVANAIVDRFATCRYAHVKAVTWHPRLVGRRREGEAANPLNARRCRWPIGSALMLLGLAADWLFVYWTRVVHLRAKGYIVAFDWTYFDLIDHKPDRYGVEPRLPGAWSWLLPRPDLVFLLDSNPEAVRHPTPPVPPVELAYQRNAYSTRERGLPRHHVLNESLPLSVLVDEIQRVVRARMWDRSPASFGGVHSPIPAPLAAADGSSVAPTSLGIEDGAR